MANRCSRRRTRPFPSQEKPRCGPRPTASPISTPSPPGRCHDVRQGGTMTYALKPLPCDPTCIKGMSEKLIVSHYENNYGGAGNRLNTITAPLAELHFSK